VQASRQQAASTTPTEKLIRSNGNNSQRTYLSSQQCNFRYYDWIRSCLSPCPARMRFLRARLQLPPKSIEHRPLRIRCDSTQRREPGKTSAQKHSQRHNHQKPFLPESASTRDSDFESRVKSTKHRSVTAKTAPRSGAESTNHNKRASYDVDTFARTEKQTSTDYCPIHAKDCILLLHARSRICHS
jgi:hypothetical protein